jgi:hypothetical protein
MFLVPAEKRKAGGIAGQDDKPAKPVARKRKGTGRKKER